MNIKKTALLSIATLSFFNTALCSIPTSTLEKSVLAVIKNASDKSYSYHVRTKKVSDMVLIKPGEKTCVNLYYGLYYGLSGYEALDIVGPDGQLIKTYKPSGNTEIVLIGIKEDGSLGFAKLLEMK